ncbi:MAG TPA: MBL fold metallo-hydrolase [Thermoanaerobaculia bacterium]|nr:MBL fold metallo-hydrolase [Thermoanaerobaculia bacterium]
MSTKKSSGKTKTGKQIRLRMYNVGFGDCFLLRIPTDDGERRMLVDCGYHSQGKAEFTDIDLVKQIVADLKDEPLDVVVATHRHQDHISGFGETDLWTPVKVEEVWLPFTADPEAAKSEPALRAWEGLMDAARGLWDDEKKQLTPVAVSALSARDPGEQQEAAFMVWNARKNAPGIANLLTGMKRGDGRPSRRRFLPQARKKYPTHFTTPVLPGVKIHVLGPPVDPVFRKNKKVPESWAFGDGTASPGDPIDSCFPPEWRVPTERLPDRKPFTNSKLKSIRQFNDDLLYAVKALDGFINGESLVLVLEIGKARLLLTGDAEVGAWMTILGNEAALALAASATFVKVGHHGSHNATPIVFVREHLAKAVPAILSTQAGDESFRNGIPLQELLDAMTARKMPFVRSDDPVAVQGLFEPDPDGKWVDCFIPC